MRRLELAQGTKSPEEAFVDAILYSRQQGFQSTPRILSFYPEANNNPFQQLLFSLNLELCSYPFHHSMDRIF